LRAAWLVFVAGCVAPARPPADLTAAQRTLGAALSAPFAEQAAAEIAEAEAALSAAERAHAARPWSADALDDAYVARRAAEKAAAAEAVSADRRALLDARAMAARLAADRDRRAAFFASIARRRALRAEAMAALERRHREVLAAAGVRLVERGDAPLARFAAEEIFLAGTSLLRDGAEDRLANVARALRQAPPFLLEIAVLDDAPGFRTAAPLLASRRAQRLRDTLAAHGVPEDALLAGHPAKGTQVDLAVIAPELPLPPDPEDH
jgi:outer membrane protein OmpA-like peptidoglycan-associated protein